MESFFLCVNAVLPIFLTMSAGLLAQKAGWIKESDVPRMNAVTFKAFMPIMCFYNIYVSDLSNTIRLKALLFGVIAVLTYYALSLCYAMRFVKDNAQRGVVVQGLYRSNYVILGLPFVSGLVGPEALGVASILGAVIVPIFNALAVITLEAFHNASGEGEAHRLSPWKLAIDVLKNPLIIGSAAGLIVLFSGIRLPVPLETCLRDMGRVASPMMLFLLGASFRIANIRTHKAQLFAVCLGRLIIIPALVLPVAALMGFRGAEFVSFIAMCGSSTAAASYTMAQQMGGDAALAGDIVVITSALCSFSLFLWAFLFRLLGMY